MGGGGNNVGIGNRVHVKSRRHKACDVSHVHHEHCPSFVRYFAEFCKVYRPGIRGRTRNYELGPVFQRLAPYHAVVDSFADRIKAVRYKLILPAGEIHRAAMGKMTTMGKIHAQYPVTLLQQSKVHCHVCAGAAVGLNVGVICAEKLAGLFPG